MAHDDDVYLPEVLYEIQKRGRYLRVTAIDPLTAVEAISVCDASYPQELIKRLAARKLQYVLRKRRTQDRILRGQRNRGILA